MSYWWSIIQKLTSRFRVPLVIWLRSKGMLAPFQSILTNWRVHVNRRNDINLPIPEDSLVLIVCANYNHAQWLSGCINSVLNQSFAQWHLVIADDLSTDDSILTLETWKNHPKISIIQLSQNRGAYIARNTAIEHAKNLNWTHVTFIDPDDTALPQWLEHGMHIIGDQQFAWARSLLKRIDKDLKTISTYHGYCQTLFTRSIWEKIGGFADVRVSGDTEVIERLRLLKRLQPNSQLGEYYAYELGQICRVHDRNASMTNLEERKIWLENKIREMQKWVQEDSFYQQPAISPYRELSNKT